MTFRFPTFKKEQLKKCSTLDLCRLINTNISSKTAIETLEERYGDTYMNVMNKLDKTIDISGVKPKDIYKLKYDKYEFPISKYIYAIYCRNYGFMTEKDILYLLKWVLHVPSYLVAREIERNGTIRVAGMLNYVLMNYLHMRKDTSKCLLEKNEIGYTFPFGNESIYYSCADDFATFIDYDRLEVFEDLLNKWRLFFRDFRPIKFTGNRWLVNIYVDYNGREYTLSPRDFDASCGQCLEKENEIKADFEEMGCEITICHTIY